MIARSFITNIYFILGGLVGGKFLFLPKFHKRNLQFRTLHIMISRLLYMKSTQNRNFMIVLK